MGSIADWFTFKSAKQRARDERNFARWAFPYGEAQKEKIIQLIRELMPKEDPKAALSVFLMGRQAYRGSFRDDPEDLAERTKQDQMDALDAGTTVIALDKSTDLVADLTVHTFFYDLIAAPGALHFGVNRVL